MRSSTAAALMLLSGLSGARGADLPAAGTRAPTIRTVLPEPEVAVVPLCPSALPLERSRFTGQPLTVVYNDPGLLPCSVVPDIALVPLPRVPQFHTKAAYPRGY